VKHGIFIICDNLYLVERPYLMLPNKTFQHPFCRRICISHLSFDFRSFKTKHLDWPELFRLIIWCQQSLVGNPLFPLKFALKKWPTPLRTQRFGPISAH